jgi:hypothetical protein
MDMDAGRLGEYLLLRVSTHYMRIRWINGRKSMRRG